MSEQPKAESKSTIVRLMNEFKRPGQSTKEFNEEIKQLTDKDKADFREWFNAAGLPTV